jgi:hypothetical protein
MAAHGPNINAITAEPTACPVVPPGIGTLNIIIRKANADAIPRNGTTLTVSLFLSFFIAMLIVATNATYRGT